MTIAVTLKVNDGLVLAADSASTLTGPQGVVNVYNNANKIANLRKGLPVGLITWGLGAIAGQSISTLAKDLRRRFSGDDPAYKDWHLDMASYTMSEVADRVKEFMYDERYEPEAKTGALPSLGFLAAGYSAGEDLAEEYYLELTPTGCTGPDLLRKPEETGISWAGQPESLNRLIMGYGLQLGGGLAGVLENELGVAAGDVPDWVAKVEGNLSVDLATSGMPIQDAIDLAEFLVSLAIHWSRFMPGSPTVGGPIESAAISKHEGFKWIKRKHYYDRELNPEVI